MAAIYTTGTWIPYSGMDADFVRAWTEFARWASIEGLRDWNRSAEFLDRIAHVLQHVDEFHPFELRVAATDEAPR